MDGSSEVISNGINGLISGYLNLNSNTTISGSGYFTNSVAVINDNYSQVTYYSSFLNGYQIQNLGTYYPNVGYPNYSNSGYDGRMIMSNNTSVRYIDPNQIGNNITISSNMFSLAKDFIVYVSGDTSNWYIVVYNFMGGIAQYIPAGQYETVTILNTKNLTVVKFSTGYLYTHFIISNSGYNRYVSSSNTSIYFNNKI